MDIQEFATKIKTNAKQVIKGKDKEIELVIMAMLANGHVLLEDVPGTGKTVLAKTLAKSINSDFKRIQFTPDLLPSDITGINFFNMKEQEFVFKKGPIFTNILLADEINRATPRTQSALLECMEERQATIGGDIYKMQNPFLVLATQNPVEIQGTYPLPEAQLDRFIIRLSLGYGDKQAEMDVLDAVGNVHPVDKINAVVTADELISASISVGEITVNQAVKEYITDIGIATRNHKQIKLGLSTRGLIALKRMAQAHAGIRGREFVTPDDVKFVAEYVIPHRLICRGFMMNESANTNLDVVMDILNTVSVPTESI